MSPGFPGMSRRERELSRPTGGARCMDRRCSAGPTMRRSGDIAPDFYFTQDWDLWYRLAERGGFLFLPEALYQFRVTEGSITSKFRPAQTRLQALARSCRDARRRGASEEPYLSEARTLRPENLNAVRAPAGTGAYFLGRTLLSNRDSRARGYLRAYVRQRPLDPRGWVSLVQASFLKES